MSTKIDDERLRSTDLYQTLSLAFPQYRTKQLIFDIPGLAKDIGMSSEGIYKWIRANRISPEGAKKLIALSAGTRTALQNQDLVNYVLN